jgi:hypothetical protein
MVIGIDALSAVFSSIFPFGCLSSFVFTGPGGVNLKWA